MWNCTCTRDKRGGLCTWYYTRCTVPWWDLFVFSSAKCLFRSGPPGYRSVRKCKDRCHLRLHTSPLEIDSYRPKNDCCGLSPSKSVQRREGVSPCCGRRVLQLLSSSFGHTLFLPQKCGSLRVCMTDAETDAEIADFFFSIFCPSDSPKE